MFFTKLWRTVMMAGRVGKNALLRPFRAISTRIRRSTNLTRKAMSAAPKAAKGLMKVKLKPESREDFVETKNAYVAKSFFVVLLLAVIGGGALVYFVIWPLLQGWFFTAHMPVTAEKAADYNGRVVLYYDDAKTEKYYKGRLTLGKQTGSGEEYYQDGTLKYEGDYVNGLYAGKGKLYDQTGAPLYEGMFAEGLYDGQGVLYKDGVRAYQGEFSGGLKNGQGAEYENGDMLLYEGGFVQDARSGNAKAYENGVLVYEGGYQGSSYSGTGKTYYTNGTLASEGNFSGGRLSGNGMDYYESGGIRYRGVFDMGVYEGPGAYYDTNGKLLYKGDFSLGQYEGTGVLYYPSGNKHYEGQFSGGQPAGESVQVYKEDGTLIYAGGFQNDAYEGTGKLMLGTGNWIEGTFASGEAQGNVRYYVNSLLYYEGGYAGGMFNGPGRIFSPFGETVYTGEFKNGLPDGTALHGKPASEVYALLGEGNYASYEKEDGTLLVSSKYHIAVFLCFPTAETEAVVHRVYVYDASLLAPYTLATFPLPEGTQRTGRGASVQIDGVSGLEGGAMYSRRLTTKDYFITLWSKAEDGAIQLVEFKSTTPLPDPALTIKPSDAAAGTETGTTAPGASVAP